MFRDTTLVYAEKGQRPVIFTKTTLQTLLYVEDAQ